ncbi:MAG: hypothetical protein ABI586_05880 [Candidatus Nanopelagicales bacterium]
MTKMLIGTVAASLGLMVPAAAHADPNHGGRLLTADCGTAGTYTLRTTPQKGSAVTLVGTSTTVAVLVELNGYNYSPGLPASKLTTCTVYEADGSLFGTAKLLFTPQG